MSDHDNEHLPTTGEVEDGFAGYNDDENSLRIIQGDVLKFGNDGIWSDRSTTAAFPPDRELVVVDLQRVSQKWVNKEPIETRPYSAWAVDARYRRAQRGLPEIRMGRGPEQKPVRTLAEFDRFVPDRPVEHGEIHFPDQHDRRQHRCARDRR